MTDTNNKHTAGKESTPEKKSSTKPQHDTIAYWGVLVAAIVATIYFFQLKTMQETLVVDQRAWLGVVEVETPKELREGTILDSTVYLLNSGKTPAFNVVQRAGFRILKAEDSFDPAHEVSITTPKREGIVLPNGKRVLSVDSLGAIGQQRADELTSGRYRMYLFGQVTYDDFSHSSHRTQFSMRMENGKGGFAFAPYGSYDYAD